MTNEEVVNSKKLENPLKMGFDSVDEVQYEKYTSILEGVKV